MNNCIIKFKIAKFFRIYIKNFFYIDVTPNCVCVHCTHLPDLYHYDERTLFSFLHTYSILNNMYLPKKRFIVLQTL